MTPNNLVHENERLDELHRNGYYIIQDPARFCFGMDAVLLSPNCCDPLHRRAVRVSMGTVFQVPWAYLGADIHTWPQDAFHTLKNLGFSTAAMALDHRAVPITDAALKSEAKLAIVLGTEGDGLCTETISGCNYTVMIPMSHGVDSLNVAAASAVAFWELRTGAR